MEITLRTAPTTFLAIGHTVLTVISPTCRRSAITCSSCFCVSPRVIAHRA